MFKPWTKIGKAPGHCMWARGFMRIEQAFGGGWRCWDVLRGLRSTYPTTVHATLRQAKAHGDAVVDRELLGRGSKRTSAPAEAT